MGNNPGNGTHPYVKPHKIPVGWEVNFNKSKEGTSEKLFPEGRYVFRFAVDDAYSFNHEASETWDFIIDRGPPIIHNVKLKDGTEIKSGDNIADAKSIIIEAEDPGTGITIIMLMLSTTSTKQLN